MDRYTAKYVFKSKAQKYAEHQTELLRRQQQAIDEAHAYRAEMPVLTLKLLSPADEVCTYVRDDGQLALRLNSYGGSSSMVLSREQALALARWITDTMGKPDDWEDKELDAAINEIIGNVVDETKDSTAEDAGL